MTCSTSTKPVGHYIIADRPLTEDEWIEQRTKLIDSTRVAAQSLPNTDETAKPLDYPGGFLSSTCGCHIGVVYQACRSA